MLLRYFGFEEDPFGATPDPRFLYQSETHREALASLTYGFFSNRGFTALIARPGMGKTTLLFRMLDDIRESASSVFLFDTQCEPRELVGYILRDLGITPGRDAVEMHEQLNGVLMEAARAGRKLVVVIDEAQNLSDAALETVRLLTNFETRRAKLMQIVLAGQPQLSDRLTSPSMVQLLQRISTVCRLEPFSAGETRAYVGHRLKLAGYTGGPLFTEDALGLIAEASQGIPRTINNLCFNSLSLCCALKRKQVDGNMVREAVADLQLIPAQANVVTTPPSELSVGPMREPARATGTGPRVRPWAIAATVLMVASVVGLAGLSRSHGKVDTHPAETKVVAAPVAEAAQPSEKAANAGDGAKTTPMEVTVEAHQTLGDIALEYMGGVDRERLRQILTLNPALTDPNLIQPGQKIRLPAPPAGPLAENAAPPAGRASQ
jgi:type II secretory pathway predicted ATPase ExeA